MLSGDGSVMPVRANSCMGEINQIILSTNGTGEENCGTPVWCALEPAEIDGIGSLSLLHIAFSHG